MLLHLFLEKWSRGIRASVLLPPTSKTKSIHFRVLAMLFHIQHFVSMVKYSHPLSQEIQRRHNLYIFFFIYSPLPLEALAIVVWRYFLSIRFMRVWVCMASIFVFVSSILSRQKDSRRWQTLNYVFMFACIIVKRIYTLDEDKDCTCTM